MMARASDRASIMLLDPASDPSFMQAKLASAQIFMTHHLPQVHALAATIMTGDDAVLAMDADWL